MPVNLFIVYARSGGTLLNQCLASLPNTIVISEVSQWGGGSGSSHGKTPTTVWDQAKEWYNVTLNSRHFISAILELEEYCIENGLHLIIRDWTYASFTPFRLNNFNPSYTLETMDLLSKETEIQPFCLIRNSIDVWISSGKPDIDQFFTIYEAYVKSVLNKTIPVFKYEDFCANPHSVMKDICRLLSVPFDANFKKHYKLSKANGDTQLGQHSRGIRQQEIKPLKRKWIRPSEVLAINRSIQQKECNRLMGYEDTYIAKNFTSIDYCTAAGQLVIDKIYSNIFPK
jgi:hypothetical protein